MSDHNYFQDLYKIDVTGKTKKKNNLTYLSWAAAWAEVKKIHPDATFVVHESTISYAPDGTTPSVTRPWFDDGRSAWVKVSVTIDGLTHTEPLAIMDFKNQSIPAEKVTSVDAVKSIQRALTKCCARHGLGLYIYEGEDLPEESKEVEKLREECFALVIAKSKLSDGAKEKCATFCKEAAPEANGDPRLIEDVQTLKTLKLNLMGIRK